MSLYQLPLSLRQNVHFAKAALVSWDPLVLLELDTSSIKESLHYLLQEEPAFFWSVADIQSFSLDILKLLGCYREAQNLASVGRWEPARRTLLLQKYWQQQQLIQQYCFREDEYAHLLFLEQSLLELETAEELIEDPLLSVAISYVKRVFPEIYQGEADDYLVDMISQISAFDQVARLTDLFSKGREMTPKILTFSKTAYFKQ